MLAAQELLTLYNGRTPIIEIARLNGTSTRTVMREIRRLGAKPRGVPCERDLTFDDPLTLEIRRLWRTGLNIKQIAATIGRTVDIVGFRLTPLQRARARLAHTPAREPKPPKNLAYRPMTPDEIGQMLEMRKKRKSISRIAKLLGRSPQTIRQRLREARGKMPKDRKKSACTTWPKQQTTPKLAMKGRKYEDMPNIPVGNYTRAILMGQAFLQRA